MSMPRPRRAMRTPKTLRLSPNHSRQLLPMFSFIWLQSPVQLYPHGCQVERMRELAFCLLLEGEGEQPPVHLQATVVVDESHFPEPVHEVAHACARSTHHLGESFVADLHH